MFFHADDHVILLSVKGRIPFKPHCAICSRAACSNRKAYKAIHISRARSGSLYLSLHKWTVLKCSVSLRHSENSCCRALSWPDSCRISANIKTPLPRAWRHPQSGRLLPEAQLCRYRLPTKPVQYPLPLTF